MTAKPATAKTTEKPAPAEAKEAAKPAPAAVETAPATRPAGRNNLSLLIGAAVLIEVAVVLALAFGTFPNIEKGPLLWFASIFPLASFIFFGWLIARHGNKLSGAETSLPGGKLLAPMSRIEQQGRFLRELTTLAEEIALATGYRPDDQTVQEMALTYLVAGDLALRWLDAEHGGALRRHVLLEDVPFDGVAVKPREIYAVEFKLLPNGDISRETLRAVLDKTAQAARRLQRTAPGSQFCLVLLCVVALTPEDRSALSDQIMQRLGDAKFDVDLLVLDYNELHQTFARELIF
jgi:hypothetical protein